MYRIETFLLHVRGRCFLSQRIKGLSPATAPLPLILCHGRGVCVQRAGGCGHPPLRFLKEYVRVSPSGASRHLPRRGKQETVDAARVAPPTLGFGFSAFCESNLFTCVLCVFPNKSAHFCRISRKVVPAASTAFPYPAAKNHLISTLGPGRYSSDSVSTLMLPADNSVNRACSAAVRSAGRETDSVTSAP